MFIYECWSFPVSLLALHYPLFNFDIWYRFVCVCVCVCVCVWFRILILVIFFCLHENVSWEFCVYIYIYIYIYIYMFISILNCARFMFSPTLFYWDYFKFTSTTLILGLSIHLIFSFLLFWYYPCKGFPLYWEPVLTLCDFFAFTTFIYVDYIFWVTA